MTFYSVFKNKHIKQPPKGDLFIISGAKFQPACSVAKAGNHSLMKLSDTPTREEQNEILTKFSTKTGFKYKPHVYTQLIYS